MRQYKDKNGTTWEIVVDIGQVARVRDLVKVDLYGLFDTEARRLFADPVLLVNTLYALCKDQADIRKVDDIAFGRTFDGDALERAAGELLEAVIDFFPSSRGRILRATVAKSAELATSMQTEALSRIERLSVTDLLKPSARPVS